MARSAALVISLALASAAALSSCSATNPLTTTEDYDPSDGVSVTLGDVTAHNVLVLTAAAGETGALQGTLSNSGTTDVDVVITADGDEVAELTVPASGALQIGGGADTDVTYTVPDAPGALTSITLATGPGGTATVKVPVLDGTLPEYADLVPAVG